MLMMPPALTTKSGAQRIPRAASSSATARRSRAGCWRRRRSPRQRSRPIVVGGRRPARTARARRRSRSSASSGSTQRAPSPRRARACAGRCRRRRARAPPWAQASARRRRRGRGRGRRRAPLEGLAAERALAGDARSRSRRRSPSTGWGRPSRRPAREPGHVARASRDHACRGRGADVLGRQVAAAERVDGVAEVAQHRRARAARRGVGRAQHDHALAAAQRQPGDRGLERHRARQAQHVAHAPRARRRRSTCGSRRAPGRARSSGRRPS